MDIFLSVGSTATAQQEAFVRAIEDRLRAEGLNPQTVGRTYFTADSPFTGVNKLMDSCRGVVVVALERLFVEAGTEKRGSSSAVDVAGIKMSTPWNHIEAALGYARNLPTCGRGGRFAAGWIAREGVRLVCSVHAGRSRETGYTGVQWRPVFVEG